MREIVVILGLSAAYLAIAAAIHAVRIYRKPPQVRDLDKDWLGN